MMWKKKCTREISLREIRADMIQNRVADILETEGNMIEKEMFA